VPAAGDMTELLVVEDEFAMATVITEGLLARGYKVHTVASGADAITAAADSPVSAVILDLGLPDMDGLEVCRRIREWSEVPIIVVTADGAEDRKIAALDGGADDYVTKPFSPAELVARVKAVLRRAEGAGPAAEIVQVGNVTIDVGRREVRVGDDVVAFTTKEFDLLKFLAERPGLALSRQQILDGVWGYDWYGDIRTVDVHIAQVRKKLDNAVNISTVRGVGYRLDAK